MVQIQLCVTSACHCCIVGRPSIDRWRTRTEVFFMTLKWLKNYDTEAVLAGRFNLDEKTIRLWCEYYSECLHIIGQEKIQLPRQWGAAAFLGIVDGTHCRCYKPRHPEFPFDSTYKSYKLGKDALSYEVMINMNGLPIWVNGPFPAGLPDIKIFNARLAALIPDGKLVLGDLGYRGPAVCSVPNEYDSYAVSSKGSIEPEWSNTTVD